MSRSDVLLCMISKEKHSDVSAAKFPRLTVNPHQQAASSSNFHVQQRSPQNSYEHGRSVGRPSTGSLHPPHRGRNPSGIPHSRNPQTRGDIRSADGLDVTTAFPPHHVAATGHLPRWLQDDRQCLDGWNNHSSLMDQQRCFEPVFNDPRHIRQSYSHGMSYGRHQCDQHGSGRINGQYYRSSGLRNGHGGSEQQWDQVGERMPGVNRGQHRYRRSRFRRHYQQQYRHH